MQESAIHIVGMSNAIRHTMKQAGNFFFFLPKANKYSNTKCIHIVILIEIAYEMT